MAHDISHLSQQNVNLVRDDPEGAEIWSNVLGTAEESVAKFYRSAPSMESGNQEFIRSSPHAKRHVRARAMGIKTQRDL